MGWKFGQIAVERRVKAEEAFASATRDELISHIARVEACLYTLAFPLSGLDLQDPGRHRSAYASSKLFPAQFDGIPEGKFAVYNKETKDFEAAEIPDEKLHEIDYSVAESISIDDGRKLSDDFEVIAVHQSDIASYIGCGAIWMRDIRRAAALLWPGTQLAQQASGDEK